MSFDWKSACIFGHVYNLFKIEYYRDWYIWYNIPRDVSPLQIMVKIIPWNVFKKIIIIPCRRSTVVEIFILWGSLYLEFLSSSMALVIHIHLWSRQNCNRSMVSLFCFEYDQSDVNTITNYHLLNSESARNSVELPFPTSRVESLFLSQFIKVKFEWHKIDSF